MPGALDLAVILLRLSESPYMGVLYVCRLVCQQAYETVGLIEGLRVHQLVNDRLGKRAASPLLAQEEDDELAGEVSRLQPGSLNRLNGPKESVGWRSIDIGTIGTPRP